MYSIGFALTLLNFFHWVWSIKGFGHLSEYVLWGLQLSFSLRLIESTHVYTADYTYNVPSRLPCQLPKGRVATKFMGTTGNSSKHSLLPWRCLSSPRTSLFWPGGTFVTSSFVFAHIQSCICQLAAYWHWEVADTQLQCSDTRLSLGLSLLKSGKSRTDFFL